VIAVLRIDEPWPDRESLQVVEAIRAQVRLVDDRTGADGGAGNILLPDVIPRDDGLDADWPPSARPEPESNERSERRLTEAGRCWAEAHRSASLMRSRLEALGSLLDEQPEPARSGYLAAWHRLMEVAALTSLGRMEREALVDPLTGAGNRRALEVTLDNAIGAARQFGSRLVVVAVDLDGLKRINDTDGHPAGDRALERLADGMVEGLRLSDSVFRSGGDEFVLIIRGAGPHEVHQMMQRIADGDVPAFSWGTATLDDDHQSATQLLEDADADLYRHRRLTRQPVAEATAAPPPPGDSGPSLVLLSSERLADDDRVDTVGPADGDDESTGGRGVATDDDPGNHQVDEVTDSDDTTDHTMVMPMVRRRTARSHRRNRQARHDRRRRVTPMAQVAVSAAVLAIGGVAVAVHGLATPSRQSSAQASSPASGISVPGYQASGSDNPRGGVSSSLPSIADQPGVATPSILLGTGDTLAASTRGTGNPAGSESGSSRGTSRTVSGSTGSPMPASGTTVSSSAGSSAGPPTGTSTPTTASSPTSAAPTTASGSSGSGSTPTSTSTPTSGPPAPSTGSGTSSASGVTDAVEGVTGSVSQSLGDGLSLVNGIATPAI